jgi:hypothetical protein
VQQVNEMKRDKKRQKERESEMDEHSEPNNCESGVKSETVFYSRSCPETIVLFRPESNWLVVMERRRRREDHENG